MENRLALPFGVTWPSSEDLLARAGRLQALTLKRTGHRLLGLRAGTTFHRGRSVPYWASSGSGEALVFVHGFAADHSSWLPLALRLRSSGRRLVLLDLPGFGDAEEIPAADNTAAHQAGAVAAVLDALAIRAAHLIGNSMGGGIAMRLALDAPSRVLSITGLGSVGPIVEHNEVTLALLRGEFPLIASSPADYERVLALALARPLPLPRALRAFWAKERAARAPLERDMLRAWIGATDDGPPWNELGNVRVPTLWLHGAEDRIVHRTSAEALAAGIPGAIMELLHGVGHLPQVEATSTVAARWVAFAAAQATKAKQKK